MLQQLLPALAFLLSSCALFAQADSLYTACSSRNKLLFGENLNFRFPATTTAKIVQIGDSHVQISHFPLAFAATVDSARSSTTENSFWFPYSMIGGYTPKGFTVTCEDASAEKMVTATDEKQFTSTGHALKILPGSHTLTISCLKNSFRAIELIVQKDASWEITAGAALIERTAVSKHLELLRISGFAENDSLGLTLSSATHNVRPLRIYGFREEVATAPLEFEFYGSSGAKFSDYLQNAALLPEYIKYMQPQLFIVSLGTNDSYLFQQTLLFRRRVRKLIKIIRANSSAGILFTLPPNTCYEGEKPRSAGKVSRAICRIAEKEKCAVWDFCAVMGGEGSMKAWNRLGLTDKDLLHLNKPGYELQGRLLADALIRSGWQHIVKR